MTLTAADVAKAESVYPTDLRARADVNRWMFWSAHHFTPAVSVLNWENMVKGMLGAGPADPKEVERGNRLVADCVRLLETHLAEREWLSQGRITLADIAVATPLMTRMPAKLPIDGVPHLLAWFDRVQALPAWRETSL